MDGKLSDDGPPMKPSANASFAQGQAFKYRILIAQAFVVFCFGILIARFAYLQIFKHEMLSQQAQMNRTAQVPIEPARGSIVD